MKSEHEGLTYDDYRRRAAEDGWSDNERIGFPDSYRSGAEASIFADIVTKVPVLNETGRTIVDIGCGCGPLARLIIAHCVAHHHRLIMVDSAEMLALLPPTSPIEFRAHRFPRDRAFGDELRSAADAVLLYSVVQTEFLSGDLWSMFDAVCELLAAGGRALLGDIPNRSMRTRLFSSENGRAYHRSFTGAGSAPPVPPYGLSPGEIDDAVVLGLLARARNQAIHAYVVPQHAALPFSNRREDIVLHRP